MFQFRAVTLGRAPRFTHRYLGIHFPQNNFISRRGVVSATMAGGTQSVSGVIKHDHRELEDYYNRILKSKDKDEQTRYQNQFAWELARHSVAEEIVVYPAMQKFIQHGQEMADKDRMEHQEAKELLYKFQGMKASDPQFIPTIETLFARLRQHMKDEEEDDLPKLEAALEDEHSEKLARSFNRTKMFVPTRSHPSAPNKPPYETVAGLLTAPIDKLRDMFSRFPKD